MPSNSDRRLDRLYPALSAKERALLALRRWKEGQDPDRRLVDSVPIAQAAAYNRYIGMIRAAGGDLSQYIAIVHGLIGQLDLRYAWLTTLLLWYRNIEDLKPHLCDRRSAAVRRVLSRAPLRVFEESEGLRHDDAQPSIDGLGRVLIDSILERANSRWQELQAVEIVLAELSAELDGEDLLHAEVRELWADGKRTLEELVEGMARFGVTVACDEPPADLVARLREIARREIEQ